MRKIPLEQAQDLLLQTVSPLETAEDLHLLDATGRVAFKDVVSIFDQPPFNRSPFDGYAFRHEDTLGLSRDNKRTFTVSQLIHAGELPQGELHSGQAARIMTGAMLPANADCVARQEDTSEEPGQVTLAFELRRNLNVCLRGEDVPAGQVILRRGTELGFAMLGVLAGQGLSTVQCFSRPKVAVISTGDELLCPGGKPEAGKIFSSNDVMLGSRVRGLNGQVKVAPTCTDDPEKLAEAILGLLATSDMAITTGGVSVGKKDYVPQAVKLLGADLLFHGVDIKPGSAVLAASVKGKLLLALSGNPFAAEAIFEVLGVPALKKLGGQTAYRLHKVKAVAVNAFNKPNSVRRLVRAKIDGAEVSIPSKGHCAGMLMSMTSCNCLVDVPANSPLITPGTQVEAVLLG